MPIKPNPTRTESSVAVRVQPQPNAVEIRQSNAITTARYDMTALEMDIMFALLSRLNKNDKPGTMYRLRVQELEQLTGREWNYARLGPSVDTLMERSYHIEVGDSWLKVGMLASAEYIKGQGVIELEISEKLRPYLIDLKSNFTSYRLQSVLSLTSKYAKRVYELASQWKDVGATKTYSLDEFKYMLNLKDPTGKEPEQYVQISALKKFVLDIAVQQINEHTDLTISYKLGKVGRSYQTVGFYVVRQQPQQLPIPFELSEEDARVQMARKHLDDLAIKDTTLVNHILSSEVRLKDLFAFVYKLKTSKIKAATNAGGLFLKMHGLVGYKESVN
ncbi:plasmid replication initiation protein [Hymenobacter luteus]|uniref:Plasmid replication initiation protein n=2 Tax=Hymenobacter TaxID=89966 RepID=A0A7W9T5Q7_9BACT|nr:MULTISPECIES: replication initiation protein [Hymenobacter]MBB4603586.1 plasmid replication initiation protein [Hymenobacter latericoloratus]MBB6061334.1 plasmid replication initiation protein [Hymenobacter luteus]